VLARTAIVCSDKLHFHEAGLIDYAITSLVLSRHISLSMRLITYAFSL